MNKTLKLSIALTVIVLATSGCKTKQKIVEIPAGANIEAKAPVADIVPLPATTEPTVATPTVVAEQEITRNENFSLAEGETNTAAMQFKYHVVVGSFKSQANAKGLQNTLNAEGNKAIIVINEQAMFRVLIASFNDYAQARTRIKAISARFPDAWVLVKK